MRRTLRLVAVAASIAVGGGLIVTPSAGAAPSCPTSLRSVPGGSGDVSSNGYDDGMRGEDAAYVGGRIIIGLDDSANAEVLDCIADELGAQVELGQKPRIGMLGLDHVALLQLPPGRSVSKTIDLLTRSRYADFIEYAEPDQYYETNAIQPPNDPMFGIQWGLMNQGSVAPKEDQYSGTQPSRQIAETSTTSMRFPQAWEYMRRSAGVTQANPRGLFDRVNVAIVDNSYFAHPELIRNSDLGAGGTVFGFGTGMQIKIATEKRDRFAIVLGTLPEFEMDSRPWKTCQIQADAPVEEYEVALTKGIDELCGYDDVDVYDLVISGGYAQDESQGRFQVNYGNTVIGNFRANSRSATIQAEFEAKLGVEVSVTTLLAEDLGNGVLRTVRRIIIPAEAEVGFPTATIGTMLSPDPEKPPSVSVVRASGARVSEVDVIPAGDIKLMPGLWRELIVNARPPAYLSGQIKPPFFVTPVSKVEITAGSISVANEENGWPGRIAATEESPLGGVHGENIAGMIGAEANNGLGITGAIGPYHNIKMYGLVAGNMSTVAITGAIQTILERNTKKEPDRFETHVVNLSLGSANSEDTVFVDPKKADPMKATTISKAISSAGKNSPTLFVAAAGNTGGNLNDQMTRNNVTYGGERKVSGDPCRPKGHGVSQRPEQGGENYYYKTLQDQRNNKRTKVTKGGTLNYLKMPDGTFDRGNLLCVGSVDWSGNPSIFTDWGRGVVDVGAPGSNIPGTSANDSYDVGSGTSYSAPLVAAAAALVYSKLRPMNRDPWLVKCALLSSATTQPLVQPSETDLVALAKATYQRGGDAFNRTLDTDPRSGYGSGPDADQMGPNGEMFTVNGTVNAQLAIKAAQSLARKVNRGEHPTCVQRRTFFGGWTNTRTQ